MSDKKITDLQLRSSVIGTLNIPADDTIQTYRITAAQLKAYILPAAGIERDRLAAGAVAKLIVASKTGAYTMLDASDDLILGDATSAAFTITLPASSGLGGRVFQFVKTDSSINHVIIDANSSETIGGALAYRLSAQYQTVTIISDGTNWQILASSKQRQICLIQHEVAQNTGGGTANAATWDTRVLNASYGGTGFMALSSNQFTLQPGDYVIDFETSFYNCGATQARLVNVTDTTYTYSTPGFSPGTGSQQDAGVCHGTALLSLSAAKVFKVEMKSIDGYPSAGQGRPANIGPEIYARVKIEKLA